MLVGSMLVADPARSSSRVSSMKHVGIMGIIDEGIREQRRTRGKHVREILGVHQMLVGSRLVADPARSSS